MTETTTTSQPTADSGDEAIPAHPTDILIALIVTFLVPLFLGCSSGDVAMARRAALETVNAYRVRDQADLLAVAQIIAFGLAALGSLSLSMLDELTLPMILRLRGNANACNRSAEMNRRSRTQSVAAHGRPMAAPTTPQPPPPIREPLDPAALNANLASVRRELAAVNARIAAPADTPDGTTATTTQPAAMTGASSRIADDRPAASPAQAQPTQAQRPQTQRPQTQRPQAQPTQTQPLHQAPPDRGTPAQSAPYQPAPAQVSPNRVAPSPNAPSQAPNPTPDQAPLGATTASRGNAPLTPDQRNKAIWAAAMADVAAEFSAEIATLPPAERWQASMRANALTQTAKTLLAQVNNNNFAPAGGRQARPPFPA